MDNKILIELYVPILEQQYDIFVPVNKKIKNVAKLLNDAVVDLSNGTLPKYEYAILYNKVNGALLNTRLNVKQAGLVNGSKVLLILI